MNFEFDNEVFPLMFSLRFRVTAQTDISGCADLWNDCPLRGNYAATDATFFVSIDTVPVRQSPTRATCGHVDVVNIDCRRQQSTMSTGLIPSVHDYILSRDPAAEPAYGGLAVCGQL